MHSRPKAVSLSIGSGRLLYRIVDIAPHININALKCINCGGSLAIVAGTTQWGFFEDEYHYYTLCEHCGKPTCFRQIVPTYEVEREGNNNA